MAKVGDKDIEESILKVTTELLFRYGVKGWNMDDLSRECGMSKRTLYKIISNKEDLIYKSCLKSTNKQYNLIQKFINSDSGYKDQLNRFPELIPNMFDDVTIQFGPELRHEYPRINSLVEDIKNKTGELYKAFLKQGQEEQFLSADFDLDMAVGMISGIIGANIYQFKSKVEFEKHVAFALRVMLKGLLK